MFLVKRKIFFLSIFFLFCYSCRSGISAIKPNDPNIIFLESIKNMTADYIQEQFENQKVSISSGKIAIKKPDSIMLLYNDKQIKLKIVSINGNIKVFDEDLKQATYIDNQYNELMQFFTKNLKPEKMKKNKNGNLCMQFKNFGNNFESCLKIDLAKKTLSHIDVYFLSKEDKKTKNKKDKIIKIPFLKIKFKNVRINRGVNDEIFAIKDRRIFNENENLDEF